MYDENVVLIVIIALSLCVLLIIGYMSLIAYDLHSKLDHRDEEDNEKNEDGR